MYDILTRVWNICKFCKAVATISGVRVQHFYICTASGADDAVGVRHRQELSTSSSYCSSVAVSLSLILPYSF